MLKKGDNVPSFSLEGSDGKTVSSDSLKGTRYVIYFYPKDLTSGCTKEAIEFSELVDQFKAQDVAIYGVSPDVMDKHHQFIEKHDLKITLLSDPENKASSAFFAYGEKSMYGRKYMGIIRSTFVVSREGIIEEAYYKVKASGHAKKVLDCIL